jgi:hypothetical protein
MPCGKEVYIDRSYESNEEDTDPRTDAEKRIEWICEEWASALTDDTYDTWRDVRMMCYGAVQALNQCRTIDCMEDYRTFSVLGDIAFNNSLDCIRDDKYEGAKK